MHGIVRVDGFPFELQVRTRYQDAWANLSEVFADKYQDIRIKYEGGPSDIRTLLDDLAVLLAEQEWREYEHLGEGDDFEAPLPADVRELRKPLDALLDRLFRLL